jgi:aryl-alcohol dehydrogenase-like predicted oxidoreductase
MKYTKLPQTDIDVSTICLGTMTWGNQNTQKDAHEQMDYAVDQGINFFDTAEMYAVPPSPETQGLTEKYIGTWFKKSKKRDDIFLASKVAGRNPDVQYLRPDDIELCLNKTNIRFAIEASLKRLQVDHIDLYQIHWPDRDTNFFGKRGYQGNDTDDQEPSSMASMVIEEALEALKELVDEGKIRYIGLSNETPWGVMQFIKYAEMKGLPRIVSIQNAYSLILREFEVGLSEKVY